MFLYLILSKSPSGIIWLKNDIEENEAILTFIDSSIKGQEDCFNNRLTFYAVP
ncbi:MAG: hypothetical protein MR978_00420 [Spirochaetia bacterium]|nr:hypothetical protein [Spirochaetia bacterium]